ncbi:MAG TPA: sigma-54 dependent transcriptional regulator [Polyangia bacterium]
MSSGTARVLVVEDDRVARDLLCEILAAERYEVVSVGDGASAIALMHDRSFELCVTDVRMEGAGGMEVLAAFQEQSPQTPVILITAFGDVAGAMAAIQKGAYDYVSKPFNVEELKVTVGRALERRRLLDENRALKRDLASKYRIENIVGASPAMLEVYKLVARVAPTTATVLVVGESGSGKELVARAIHTHSLRAQAPFVAVNCTALTESLLESELFGHAKGAFTGAVVAKKGLFEEAHGGTLFLDEIADIGGKMQAQLLRAIQEGEIRRVGGSEPVKVDARIVAATNRDLEAEVRAGRFREDLFFRIHVVTLKLPPLRDRQSDIPLLVEHFLAKYASREGHAHAGIAPEAMTLLSRHPWPGNVRELENAIERALTLAEGGMILPSDLPPEVVGSSGARPQHLYDDRPTLAELEKRYIDLILQETGGNKKRAAEILGIDRRTLYRSLGRAEAEKEEEE